MFKLQVSAIGKFKKYEFQHEASETHFSIIPEFGALILQVTFRGRDLLNACQSAEEIFENNAYKNSLLLPFPNRLKHGKYSWNGADYQFPLNNPEPPVNALHGFACNYSTSVEKIALDDDSASIICRLDYDGEFEYYPFPFSAFFEFKIDTSGNFNIGMKIKNTGATTLPFGTGWHPYFKLDGQLKNWHLKLPESLKIEVDKIMIPTGEETPITIDNLLINSELDTGFKFKKTGKILKTVLKNENSKLTFWQETGVRKFNFLQVYIPPNRDCIAIEPMTCNIDAFNNQEGLISLSPNEEWEGKFGFSFEKR